MDRTTCQDNRLEAPAPACAYLEGGNLSLEVTQAGGCIVIRGTCFLHSSIAIGSSMLPMMMRLGYWGCWHVLGS
jgi:hypothetical protein